MRNNVILVLLDGLNHDTARECMGALQGLCEAGKACLYPVQCGLPALSRPLYECILTGRTPVQSGVTHNGHARLSRERSIFHYARAAGLTTAAAAYQWFSELYNRTPFDPVRDRHVSDPDLPIQHGHFYFLDRYPDCHLFADAENLRRRHQPHFLLVHPMAVDHAGHLQGADSALYRNSAREADALLAEYLPGWLGDGCQVLVTADHGMNADGTHNGLLPEERTVPLFTIGDRFTLNPDASPLQTEICGTICELLGVPHDKSVCAELIKKHCTQTR